MSHNLKALGLALLAVFAMSAIGAQGAWAVTEHTFEADAEDVDLTGTSIGSHVFELATNTKFLCTHVAFAGTVTAKVADQMRVIPAYSDCKLGNDGITVHNNGCEYVFDSDTNDTGDAAVDLDCDHSGSITLTVLGCVLHISDTHTGGDDTVNQDLTGVSYITDDGAANTTDSITVDFTLSEIKTEGTGLACAVLGLNGTKADSRYEGTMEVKGYVYGRDHGTEDDVGVRLATP